MCCKEAAIQAVDASSLHCRHLIVPIQIYFTRAAAVAITADILYCLQMMSCNTKMISVVSVSRQSGILRTHTCFTTLAQALRILATQWSTKDCRDYCLPPNSDITVWCAECAGWPSAGRQLSCRRCMQTWNSQEVPSKKVAVHAEPRLARPYAEFAFASVSHSVCQASRYI